MSRVHLSDVWLNDASDLSQCVRLQFAGAFTPKPAAPGQVQVLAGGRRRLAIAGPTASDWDLSSPAVDAVTTAWLLARIGSPVWVRDWLGNRLYGAYLALTPTPRLDGSGTYDVSFTVSELTPPSV